MLTLEEAKSLALDYAHKQAPAGVDLVVLDDRTIAKPYGWVMVITRERMP